MTYVTSCSCIIDPVYGNVTQPDNCIGNETAEYAMVIPRSQRNTIDIVDNNSVRDEYAVVIPKSQRKSVDNSLNENQPVS